VDNSRPEGVAGASGEGAGSWVGIGCVCPEFISIAVLSSIGIDDALEFASGGAVSGSRSIGCPCCLEVRSIAIVLGGVCATFSYFDIFT
jgi:hypothetical protein